MNCKPKKWKSRTQACLNSTSGRRLNSCSSRESTWKISFKTSSRTLARCRFRCVRRIMNGITYEEKPRVLVSSLL